MNEIILTLTLHPGELTAHPANSNTHSRANIEELAESRRGLAVMPDPMTLFTKRNHIKPMFFFVRPMMIFLVLCVSLYSPNKKAPLAIDCPLLSRKRAIVKGADLQL